MRGLLPGAPIQLKGITIGQVLDITPQIDIEKIDIYIKVLIELEDGHFEIVGNRAQFTENMKSNGLTLDEDEGTKFFMETLVAKGLRAQLITGNILTGKLLIALDFHPGASPAKIVYADLYPELPTTPDIIGNIAAKLAQVMDNLGSFPIEKIGVDLQKTIANVSTLTAKLDKLPIDQIGGDLQKTVSGLDQTVTQTKKAMSELERLLRPESPLQHDLRKSLREFSGAARSLRLMADYLEQNPEVLIRGKDKK